jgi:hypothetical protein
MENQPQNKDDAPDNNRRNADDSVPNGSRIVPNYPKYDHWYADTADYEAEETGYWRRQNKISTWAVVVNGLTLFAAVVGGGIAYNVFIQTKRQADEAHIQTGISVDQEQRSQRAYVFVAPQISLELGQRIKATVTIEAIGATPAYELRATIRSGASPIHPFIEDLSKPITEEYLRALPGTPTVAERATLYPLPHDKYPITHIAQQPATESLISQIKDGSSVRFYVWGEVTYRDAFRCLRPIKYCLGLGGPDLSGIECPGLNIPDDPGPCHKVKN